MNWQTFLGFVDGLYVGKFEALTKAEAEKHFCKVYQGFFVEIL